MVVRGTGERGERLHLRFSPLGLVSGGQSVLSQDVQGVARSFPSPQGQGHPLPAVTLPADEGVQEGPQCKPLPLRGVPALLQAPTACPDELKPLACLSPAC